MMKMSEGEVSQGSVSDPERGIPKVSPWQRLHYFIHAPRSISIEVRINLGFTFTIALMLALAGVGLTQMYQADARLKIIVEKNNVKTELAQIMQSALRERALSMHIMAVLTDDFLKDEEYQHFNELGGSYTQARQSLKKLATSAEEK